MRLGIVVNVMDRGDHSTTTNCLAVEAINRGHEVWVMSTGSLAYNPDDTIGANARTVPRGRYTSERFLDVFRSAASRSITVDDLDVLLLRNNPSVQSAWAQSAGIHFGRMAARRGVIVLNDPDGLARAMNKLYLQTFPEKVRPRTLVTRDRAAVDAFLDERETIIIKPLQGSGGRSVFIVHSNAKHNLDQIFKAVRRDGYLIAQEYLPAAAQGDTRLFLMNGVPLRYQGKVAAVRRTHAGDDIRSNIHAGGQEGRAEVDDAMLLLAEIVRPRLVEDGMFFVGLDIVGDKLMELNVFSPGGLGSAERFEKANFTRCMLEALEHKVQYQTYYRRGVSRNAQLATL